MSRMVGAAEIAKAKQGPRRRLDIVIGTHAVLGKSVSFKDLGLVIIDEEQHFGVEHKERLKELRAEVHVLTLSATPIPRTLQLALTGVRELSIIATPPVDRLAVRTFVSPFDSLVCAKRCCANAIAAARLFSSAAHRRPRGGRGVSATKRAGVKFVRRAWPDERRPNSKTDGGLLRRQISMCCCRPRSSNPASISRPPIR